VPPASPPAKSDEGTPAELQKKNPAAKN
jgi:hypothetical protein